MRGLVHTVKDDLVIATIHRKEACGECRACLSGMTKTEMDIEAKNLCDAEIGDWVQLELQENAFFNAVVIMYGLPFIGFITGVLAGYYGGPKVLPGISPVFPSLVLGVLGIVVAMLWIKSQNPRWESGKYRPLATKIVEEDDEEIINGNYKA
ncbi:MAG: SoxR reducing system RseC family protein [Anaerotignum sp.]|nr:SoxR reducing system RseC family protein [Anaerotignum sp.]MBR5794139.1 SoxR reducing system RseC family protein [Anaerotignum sp.]